VGEISTIGLDLAKTFSRCMELMGKGLWLFASGFGAARF